MRIPFRDPPPEPDDGSDERGELIADEAPLPDPDNRDIDCVEPDDEYNR